ncbi:type II secretion system protein [Candidatus Peregrinibacteria bacterium]|nr:type II secretion system protein [Candidatus Peregrinibacteria bacterium]
MKISFNKKGFTLTEVMIGISILTVAIVTATSLLVGLIHSNKNNVSVLSAYYFAQEGIEAVRNIRDTNWLHNVDWLGDKSGNPWGAGFEIGKKYDIQRKNVNGTEISVSGLSELVPFSPWGVSVVTSDDSVSSIKFFEGDNQVTNFKRVVEIQPYGACGLKKCDNFVRVHSRVFWNDGNHVKDVFLDEILTNWKK